MASGELFKTILSSGTRMALRSPLESHFKLFSALAPEWLSDAPWRVIPGKGVGLGFSLSGGPLALRPEGCLIRGGGIQIAYKYVFLESGSQKARKNT